MLGFATSIFYCTSGLNLKFYSFFDGIFLAEMGILFIINAKTLVNNIRTHYEKYFKADLIFLQVTLILSALSYLLRATYLLGAFIFFDNGISDIELYIRLQGNGFITLLSTLIIVSLTELLPIASLILTHAFILKQKSMKMKTIGQAGNNLLESVSEVESDVEMHRDSAFERIRSIRSLIINEFIDKDEANSQYQYQMKDKKAGREIFWTYHFFEYIDDYIDSNSRVESTTMDREQDSDDPNNGTINFELIANIRKQQRESSRRRKEMVKQLDREEEER